MAFGNIMSYLLKHNRVIFTYISEELSENNHLYFSSGTFPVGAQGQIHFCVCGFKMYKKGISSVYAMYHRPLLTDFMGADF